MSMKQQIQGIIDRFHAKMEKDPELKKEVMPIEKVINVDLGEGEQYSFKIKDAEVYYFESGLLDEADLTLTSTPEVFSQLIDGSLRPMRAYVLKKIQIKGKIDDLMFLKKLF